MERKRGRCSRGVGVRFDSSAMQGARRRMKISAVIWMFTRSTDSALKLSFGISMNWRFEVLTTRERIFLLQCG